MVKKNFRAFSEISIPILLSFGIGFKVLGFTSELFLKKFAIYGGYKALIIIINFE